MKLDIVKCCGCGICALVCPNEAIKMEIDDEGFYSPQINEKRCIDCGKCAKICQFKRDYEKRNHKIESINTDKEVFIGRHKSIEVINQSRSGGIFTALSDLILSKGGFVYGAILNDDLNIVHICADNNNMRNKMRGSKYSQSFVSKRIYVQIEEQLIAGKQVLFSGTSCQIAAIKNYLKSDYKNFLSMDILCHGVVSPLVFKEYIRIWEDCLDAKCIGVNFREKNDYGWSDHVERLFFKDNNTNKCFFVDSDMYKNIFYGHMCLRSSCYICPYKSQDHPGDITVGDCWGIEKIDHRYADDMGCSIIFLNSKKGNDFFERVMSELDIKKVYMSECLFQPPLSYPFEVDENERSKFWERFVHGDRKNVIEEYGHGEFKKDYFEKERIKEEKRLSLEVAFQVLDKIMCMYEEGVDISNFFEDNRIETVAIYGFGKMGRHLYYLLEKSGVKVEYAIDKQAENIDDVSLPVYHPMEKMKKVDAVIVSLATMFHDIEKELFLLMPNTYIISIETVVSYRR